MPRALPVMHHVVFAVSPERLDAAVQFLESLGFRFHRHELARRYGADTQLRQRRDADGIELLEVQLSTIFGMPLTLLSTNLP
jgi:hypothetical protein